MILNVEYTDVVRADANELENTYYSLGGASTSAALSICITKGSCCCTSSKA